MQHDAPESLSELTPALDGKLTLTNTSSNKLPFGVLRVRQLLAVMSDAFSSRFSLAC
jgi:hypothetical protein